MQTLILKLLSELKQEVGKELPENMLKKAGW